MIAAASPVETTIRLRPITPRRLRYARWFVRASYSIEAAAQLFDIDPDALASALLDRAAA